MVKKKKKSPKKISKKSPKKSPVEIKKNLELFSKGVERLKELETELSALDTRGFASDVGEINSMLKNVSDIPLIERKIKNLRLKIEKKFKPKPKRKKVVVKPNEDIQKLESDIPILKNKISKLSDKIDDVFSGQTGIVDSKVDNWVNEDFEGFLKGLKLKISEKVRNNEKHIEQVLKSDLKDREGQFHDNYDKLVKEFNNKKNKMHQDFSEKYNLAVQTSLKADVASRFREQLDKRFNSEKAELGKRYKGILKSHAEDVLQKQKNSVREKMERQYCQKFKLLENQFLNKQKEFEVKHEKWLKDVEKNQEIILKQKVSYSKYRQSQEGKLESERKNLIEAKRKFEEDKKEERNNIEKQLTGQAHKRMIIELERKKKEIQGQLKKEYDSILKKQLRKEEDDLKEKRAELELQMQERVKKMFKS